MGIGPFFVSAGGAISLLGLLDDGFFISAGNGTGLISFFAIAVGLLVSFFAAGTSFLTAAVLFRLTFCHPCSSLANSSGLGAVIGVGVAIRALDASNAFSKAKSALTVWVAVNVVFFSSLLSLFDSLAFGCAVGNIGLRNAKMDDVRTWFRFVFDFDWNWDAADLEFFLAWKRNKHWRRNR